MTESFIFYFTEGWRHIINIHALDHQLFILALTVIYTFKEWKRVLILVTAFTIGHSLTLALSVLDIFRLPSALVEVLIPITIILTAIWNITGYKKNKKFNNNYFLALFFGLIHGLGFANALRMMLASDQSLLTGLLAFNLGLEAGQIIIVFLILTIILLLRSVAKIQQKIYIFVSSVITIFLAGIMILQRI